MSKNIFKYAGYFSLFLLMCILGFLNLKDLKNFNYDYMEIIFVFLISFLISIIVFFEDKILKISFNKRDVNFFIKYLLDILIIFLIFIIFFIIFEVFYYIGYGKFEIKYLKDVFYGNVNYGKVFLKSFSITKDVVYKLLLVIASYMETLRGYIPIAFIVLFMYNFVKFPSKDKSK